MFFDSWNSIGRAVLTGVRGVQQPRSASSDIAGSFAPISSDASGCPRDEVRAAIRSSGLTGFHAVGAVVLETDGSVSVIPSDALSRGGGLKGLDNQR